MTLTCTACGAAHSAHELQNTCRECGQPLRADYFFSPDEIKPKVDLIDHPTLWRYQAFLPSISEKYRISLGEGDTPLKRIEYLGRRVYLKDETGNPTGSFKDRGMCVALSMARALGVTHVALPSAGNAAVAAASYALAGNLTCRVYLPKTIPGDMVSEIQDCGGEVVLAGQSIAEAGAEMARQLDHHWFNLSTLKEPYRIEGKKTMGLEIAEQLDWDFPDVIIYPTGGGTGLIGIWKAFQELRSLGWVRQEMPRMVVVQSEGCAPVVKAFHDGESTTLPWSQPDTRALGLNVPSPLGGAWMLTVLRESNGTAIAISEADISPAQKRLQQLSAIPVGPEAAVAWRGLELLIDQDWIAPEESVALVVTGDNRRYS
ncbi:MAG: threonine synthase [Candidatus Neomarinimicrobiota bacterium]